MELGLRDDAATYQYHAGFKRESQPKICVEFRVLGRFCRDSHIELEVRLRRTRDVVYVQTDGVSFDQVALSIGA